MNKEVINVTLQESLDFLERLLDKPCLSLETFKRIYSIKDKIVENFINIH